MRKQLIISEDGSHTLFVPELNEHYHSVYGAMQESTHVFINAGLKACTCQQLNILEVGFGTGLNALLTFFEAAKQKLNIFYSTYEPYPLDENTWMQLNYSQFLGQDQVYTKKVLKLMHSGAWNIKLEIGKAFTLQKFGEKIEVANLPGDFFNLIFFDAFSPTVQPELWTYELFSKLFEATRENGILVTYSAKGEVRRRLNKAGYQTERLPGPPGKLEMLRARKCSISLQEVISQGSPGNSSQVIR